MTRLARAAEDLWRVAHAEEERARRAARAWTVLAALALAGALAFAASAVAVLCR